MNGGLTAARALKSNGHHRIGIIYDSSWPIDLYPALAQTSCQEYIETCVQSYIQTLFQSQGQSYYRKMSNMSSNIYSNILNTLNIIFVSQSVIESYINCLAVRKITRLHARRYSSTEEEYCVRKRIISNIMNKS